jgi:hypothetical protein
MDKKVSEIKCEVIKDLLPIYADGLTSEVTNTEIEKHLAGCEDCNKFYKEISGEIGEEFPLEKQDEKEKKQIKYLHKLNRRTLKTVGLTVLGIVLVVGGVLYGCLWGVAPKKADLDIAYSVTTSDDGGQNYTVDVTLKNGKGLTFYWENTIGKESTGAITETYTLRRVLPWFRGGKSEDGKIKTNEISVGLGFDSSYDEEEIGNYKIVLHCADGDIEIKLSDMLPSRAG